MAVIIVIFVTSNLFIFDLSECLWFLLLFLLFIVCLFFFTIWGKCHCSSAEEEIFKKQP